MSMKLYVANVSEDTTEEALRSHFATCGGVLSVDLASENTRGKAKGQACVTMTNEHFAQVAQQKLDGVSFGGRILRVSDTPIPATAKARPKATIVHQFRERTNVTYELDCEGSPLIIRMFPLDRDQWRLEARATDAADADVVQASSATRSRALDEVLREWNERASSAARHLLDSPAVVRALQNVRAV